MIRSHKKTARIAGWLYLVSSLAGLYAHIYVPSQILVRNDAVATSRNLLANEFLFRSCVVANLLEAVSLLFLALTLYRLFSRVNHHLSKVMVALAGVQVPVVFVFAGVKIAALMALKGDLSATGHMPELAMQFLKINQYGMTPLEMFWGLWLLPFGMLVYQSRFMPLVLGILLIIAGIGYTADSLTAMLLPDYHSQTQLFAFTSAALAEVAVILWLLIKGAKDHLTIDIVSEAEPGIRSGLRKVKMRAK